MPVKKIVFDLDGVIRDLHRCIENKYNCEILDWHWKDKEGRSVTKLIFHDLDILVDSPPTRFASVIKEFAKTHLLEIWTNQPTQWRTLTNCWLRNYFGKTSFVVKYLTPEQKIEMVNLEKCLLVDDYPDFTEYRRVVLIDHPYNQKVDCSMRMKTPDELRKFLNL